MSGIRIEMQEEDFVETEEGSEEETVEVDEDSS
jgi:hypothetical protein